jgi:hypothetical protein
MNWKGRWYGVFWIALSVFWIDEAWAKVHDLQASGRPVSALRWAHLAFWIAMLLFWFRLALLHWSAARRAPGRAQG